MGAIRASAHAKILSVWSHVRHGFEKISAVQSRAVFRRVPCCGEGAATIEIALQWSEFITLSRVLAALAGPGSI